MSYVGQNIPHDSARGHVTGESIFLDDVLPARNELFVGVVGSPVAHGRLTRLDLHAARQVAGVVAILTHADVPGHNTFGPVLQDEELLVADEAVYLDQPVVLIAAESRQALDEARGRVVVEMQELPPVFTIDEAIAADSFIAGPRVIARGDVDGALASAEHTREGTLEIGGQEHFYLESQVAIAVPGENRTVTVHSSTQHPTECQNLIAEVLGIPFNHVTVICKRMGGGFGGKETQAAQPAMMAALVAMKTGRPARVAYTKDEDMARTGKRHPFKIRYRVGFTSDGTITAVALDLFANGGCSADLSLAVLERALLHSDNAYFIPHFRATGRICKTNLPSNTAFRGFGGPQGVAGIENVVEEVARALGTDPLDVRQRNCYGSPAPGNGHPAAAASHDRLTTPYGEIVRNNTLPELFARLRMNCDYDGRRAAIAAFNADSKTHLKGLSMTAVKFGISFTRRTLNQANALVNIYTDGTVMVSTGATEMGQGVNTRVRQLVADELGIDYGSVIVTATNTDKNNNTSPTAASSGTDLNGAAAADACVRLRARLADVAARMLADKEAGLTAEAHRIHFDKGKVFDDRRPDQFLTFRHVVCHAYELRTNLGERGFYATPGVDFNRETGKGNPFFYYTNGVACAEVLIDRFTGELKVPRVDLLMDIGQSINPGIDRGQVVGGFVQGMGWVTTEELKYDAKGHLLSHSPTTYKIPNISDLPEVFNVDTIDNPHNDVSLKRSKAVGEPPLLLGLSVWAAVKNALSHVGSGPVRLRLPATGEEILLTLTAREAATSPAPSPPTQRVSVPDQSPTSS